MYNSLLGGCAAGAVLGVKGGRQGMIVGCTGFAAFSAVIDAVTGRHE